MAARDRERRMCSWCCNNPGGDRLPAVQVRVLSTGATALCRLCRRCVGPSSTFWRSHEAIDLHALEEVRGKLHARHSLHTT
jgi:hypothetical protein